jgi:hypothetical protein
LFRFDPAEQWAPPERLARAENVSKRDRGRLDKAKATEHLWELDGMIR